MHKGFYLSLLSQLSNLSSSELWLCSCCLHPHFPVARLPLQWQQEQAAWKSMLRFRKEATSLPLIKVLTHSFEDGLNWVRRGGVCSPSFEFHPPTPPPPLLIWGGVKGRKEKFNWSPSGVSSLASLSDKGGGDVMQGWLSHYSQASLHTKESHFSTLFFLSLYCKMPHAGPSIALIKALFIICYYIHNADVFQKRGTDSFVQWLHRNLKTSGSTSFQHVYLWPSLYKHPCILISALCLF